MEGTHVELDLSSYIPFVPTPADDFAVTDDRLNYYLLPPTDHLALVALDHFPEWLPSVQAKIVPDPESTVGCQVWTGALSAPRARTASWSQVTIPSAIYRDRWEPVSGKGRLSRALQAQRLIWIAAHRAIPDPEHRIVCQYGTRLCCFLDHLVSEVSKFRGPIVDMHSSAKQ